jgi:LmbE family N-acetylglucosaminyl deacetylase
MARFDATYVPASAMTIFAHPDDAEFSCGATLACWAQAGCQITLVLCTNGNAGTHDTSYSRESLARTRAEEQRRAAEALGVRRVVCLERDDCELEPTLELRRDLVRLIREHRPEVVVCGDPAAWFYESFYINHPDHRAAARAAVEAVFPCSEMELLWPELGPAHKVHAVYVSGRQKANTYLEVSAGMDAKIAALACHASQMGDWDPSEMVREWAAGNAKDARKAAKLAKKAAKDTHGDKATTRRGRAFSASPPPSVPSGKLRHVEGFHVMVLKDEDETPPDEVASEAAAATLPD